LLSGGQRSLLGALVLSIKIKMPGTKSCQNGITISNVPGFLKLSSIILLVLAYEKALIYLLVTGILYRFIAGINRTCQVNLRKSE
jgi:hypothetical protein